MTNWFANAIRIFCVLIGLKRLMAKKSVRAQWKAKLTGKVPSCSHLPIAGSTLALGESFRGVILGIDPSLRGTGLAVLDVNDRHSPRLLASRTVRLAPQQPLAVCLGQIAEAVEAMLDGYPVDHVAVEQTIYVQNFQTAQVLGAARGAAIAVVGRRDLPVCEYPPLRIKQAVAGFGRASKEQLSKTVRDLLRHADRLPEDEADAVAVALCHAFTFRAELE